MRKLLQESMWSCYMCAAEDLGFRVCFFTILTCTLLLLFLSTIRNDSYSDYYFSS